MKTEISQTFKVNWSTTQKFSCKNDILHMTQTQCLVCMSQKDLWATKTV